MGWEQSVADQRKEIVSLALAPGANISRLCLRWRVSRKTLYKWINRAKSSPELHTGNWARDLSRRPSSSPGRTDSAIEDSIAELRMQHPCWGGRKLRKLLLDQYEPHQVPSASTITVILARRGLIMKEESLKRKAFERFEHAEPNQMWQMDFKGYFHIGSSKCYPLTVVDDHSRYSLCLKALPAETGELTRPALTQVFRNYGLPQRMFLDNGSCWGRVGASYTAFTAWLLRLGVQVVYSRPYHPQSRGKNERFHRTLKAEAITGRSFTSFAQVQKHFDQFLITYNTLRPHEALGMHTPASRYSVSMRAYPERLGPIEYLAQDLIRRVSPAGFISWNKQRFQVGRAFSGDPVAIRPVLHDGVYEVYYCHQRVAIIDRRDESCLQT